MALFFNQNKLQKEDSVYARRVARGEIPDVPTISGGNGERMKDLQNTVRELSNENSRLKTKIAKMQEYINGLHLSLSLEDTIKKVDEKPADNASSNMFSAFSAYKNATSSASSDTSEQAIADEDMANIMKYLDLKDILDDGDEPSEPDDDEQDRE